MEKRPSLPNVNNKPSTSEVTSKNQRPSKAKNQTTFSGSGITSTGYGGSTKLPFTSLYSGSETKSVLDMKEASRKSRAECNISESTSHTQFFRQQKRKEGYERITTDEFFGMSESISGSSDTFGRVHGAGGKIYTKKGLLKRNLAKELDPIPTEAKWTQRCQPSSGWELAKALEFIVTDPTNEQQKHRLDAHLKDFLIISEDGYKIEHLDSVMVIISYLVETYPKNPHRKETIIQLFNHMRKPVIRNSVFDTVKFFKEFTDYLGFLGYLLMRLEDDSMFDLVSRALIWHLSAPDSLRGDAGVKQCHTMAAAAPVLHETVVRMLAIATSHRYPTFNKIALLLACNSVDSCIELMKRNIIENIFYRFNPYFPDRMLPEYDVNPADPQDFNVKLGDSAVCMTTTMTLLLILLKTTKDQLDKDPKFSLLLPSPDEYAQRCFFWAYRYECRARDHQHQRKNLTVIAYVLVHCFGARLKGFSEVLMPDILSLCVRTEMPPRDDWTSTVDFSISQGDVQFKKLLIYFSATLIKVFPHNRTMVESSHYLLGLMYLLDPGLCNLRARWVPSLFAELRKTSLQALVCAVPRISPRLVHDYGLIRRTMWYIEWYSESPYELGILYWCLRLLQVSTFTRTGEIREKSIKTLFDTHGIIILIHLCYTLLAQKTPPVEKAQVIIALSLRLLTSAVDANAKVTCCVYPSIQWPTAINALARRMIDVVLFSLEKHYILSDRWLISMLNFIWEAIIWKKEYREKFIARDGIYKLLDIITMTRPPVQCIALSLVCDATKTGDAVGQLVTWRATLGAASAVCTVCGTHNKPARGVSVFREMESECLQTHPNVVKCGSTIATLLASIFRDECLNLGVQLDPNGIITDMESPIMSTAVREALANYGNASTGSFYSPRTPSCLAASDLAGSRMSKAYALLNMLSEDLDYKVSLADEAYNLYKNIQLETEDEIILVLCAHYLTLKLNETWIAIKAKSPGYLRHDEEVLEEFLQIGRGWAKEIKRQQENVLQMDKKKEAEEESSLYEFLARVRLNMSLDALREVRCVARSADRERIAHALLHDAVHAHHRRSLSTKAVRANVIRTYGPTLDDQNITGQNVKVFSILPKNKPKPLLDYVPSS